MHGGKKASGMDTFRRFTSGGHGVRWPRAAQYSAHHCGLTRPILFAQMVSVRRLASVCESGYPNP